MAQPQIQATNIEQIYIKFDKGLIVFPVYQRKEIWSVDKQGYLIDSIINDYVIPPLIFSEVEREINGDLVPIWNQIDGSQRGRSIVKFMKGEICSINLDEPKSPGIWYKRGDKTPENAIIMTSGMQEKFKFKTIPVCILGKCNAEKEARQYSRLQFGEPPSKGERLRVMSSNKLVGYLNSLLYDDSHISVIYKQIEEYYMQIASKRSKRDRQYIDIFSAVEWIINPNHKSLDTTSLENMIKNQYGNVDFNLAAPKKVIQRMLERFVNICAIHPITKASTRKELFSGKYALVIFYILSTEIPDKTINFNQKLIKILSSPSKLKLNTKLTITVIRETIIRELEKP